MSRLALMVLVFLCGCTATQDKGPTSYLSMGDPWQMQAEKTLRALSRGNAEEASTTVLMALNKFPDQPILHTLNGIVYETMGQESHGDNLEMAEIAYKTALNIDPNNWHTHYRMGRLKMRLRKYQEAQKSFIKALKGRPKNTRLLYDLAFASYYAKDLPCAYLSIKKAERHLSETSPRRPFYLRAAALLSAAVGKKEDAVQYWRSLKARDNKAEKGDLVFLRRRIDEWSTLHQNLQSKEAQKKWLRKAALNDDGSADASADDGGAYEAEDTGDGTADGGSDSQSDAAGSAAPQDEAPVQSVSLKDSEGNVVIFDCILLNLSEVVSTSKGMNLLENLTGMLIQIQPQSYDKTSTKGSSPDLKTTFNTKITWGTINYSANILNVGDNRIELIGRPTLSTYLGNPATFNSGRKITGAVSGGSGGSIVGVDMGTILSITPQVIEGDRVKITIDAESSTPFKEITHDKSFTDQVMEILKTRIQTTMQLKFNETAMIGGSYERITTYDRSGVPGLEKIPFVQYFFSAETNKMTKRSILFLITPRRKKDKEDRFSQHMKSAGKYNKFPDIHHFVQKNHEFLSDISTEALIYQDVWPKLEHYYRGDMLQLPETPAQKQAHSLREFIYY